MRARELYLPQRGMKAYSARAPPDWARARLRVDSAPVARMRPWNGCPALKEDIAVPHSRSLATTPFVASLLPSAAYGRTSIRKFVGCLVKPDHPAERANVPGISGPTIGVRPRSLAALEMLGRSPATLARSAGICAHLCGLTISATS